MRIYDKEALLMVILDFAILAYALGHIIRRDVEIFHIAVLLYACSDLKNNIKAVFSEEDSKKRTSQVKVLKMAYKNVFGRFAPLAPFSFFIFLGVGLLLLKIMKGSMLGAYVIIFGLFSPMLIGAIITSEIHRIETEQE